MDEIEKELLVFEKDIYDIIKSRREILKAKLDLIVQNEAAIQATLEMILQKEAEIRAKLDSMR